MRELKVADRVQDIARTHLGACDVENVVVEAGEVTRDLLKVSAKVSVEERQGERRRSASQYTNFLIFRYRPTYPASSSAGATVSSLSSRFLLQRSLTGVEEQDDSHPTIRIGSLLPLLGAFDGLDGHCERIKHVSASASSRPGEVTTAAGA